MIHALSAFDCADMQIELALAKGLLIEIREWIGDGEFSDSAGIPDDGFTPAYRAIIKRVDDAIRNYHPVIPEVAVPET